MNADGKRESIMFAFLLLTLLKRYNTFLNTFYNIPFLAVLYDY